MDSSGGVGRGADEEEAVGADAPEAIILQDRGRTVCPSARRDGGAETGAVVKKSASEGPRDTPVEKNDAADKAVVKYGELLHTVESGRAAVMKGADGKNPRSQEGAVLCATGFHHDVAAPLVRYSLLEGGDDYTTSLASVDLRSSSLRASFLRGDSSRIEGVCRASGPPFPLDEYLAEDVVILEDCCAAPSMHRAGVKQSADIIERANQHDSSIPSRPRQQTETTSSVPPPAPLHQEANCFRKISQSEIRLPTLSDDEEGPPAEELLRPVEDNHDRPRTTSCVCCNKVKLSPWEVSMIHANAP